jgi:DNA replication protein DnaD
VKAIDRAVTRNKRSLAYIHGILKSWQAGGYDDENTKAQPTPRNSKKEAIDTVNRLMAEYQAKEGEEKDDNGSIDPASDWSFATGVQK